MPVSGQYATTRRAATGRDAAGARSPEGRLQRTQEFGGNAQTEGAVEAGLRWLALHQSPDGSWNRQYFDRQCPAEDACAGGALDWLDNDLSAGVTGLALLAFLGAGYTDREGPYPQVVAAAVEALLAGQQAHGGFGADERVAGYNDALATFALAEYYALTGERRLVEPLQRAVERLAGSQQELGGWDYRPSPAAGRNDTSITSWAVQALQACTVAGVEVPRETLVKAALHFARMTESSGRVRYSDGGTGYRLNERTLRPVFRYGAGMTACGLTSTQLLGWRSDGPMLLRQRALVLGQLPSTRLARASEASQFHNEYYWYYGTIAMFQCGGEAWSRWNATLRDTLLPLQDRSMAADGTRRHSFGSWPPYGPQWGKWGRIGGRVYTTAICTLTLEIYYRHTPAYLQDELAVSAEDWRAYLRSADERDRRRALECLRELRVEIAEPVLVESLRDRDNEVVLAAAEALTEFDSPLGVEVLADVVTRLPPWERATVERALNVARQLLARPKAEGRLRLVDRERRLATLELSHAYVGMPLHVIREERVVARMRVRQRFTGRAVVVVEIGEVAAGAVPQAGDAVREP